MELVDQIAVSLAVYVIVASWVGWYAFVVRRASVFEPLGQYILFVSLFTLPLPLRSIFTQEIEGNVTPHLLTLMPAFPVSVVLVASTLPVFAWAYFRVQRQAVGSFSWWPMMTGRRDRSLLAFAVLASLSSALVWLLAEDAGGLGAFLLLGYNASQETVGRGYLAVGFPWLFVATMFLMHRYARSRRRLDLALFTLAFAAVLAINVVTGNRSFLLYAAMVVLVFVHFAIRPLGWRLLMPLGLAAFLALNLMGATRGSNYESAELFVEQSAATIESATEGSLEGLYYTLTTGQFVVPFEILPRVVSTVWISDPPWLGLSYLRAPIYLIPSAILPERPLPLSNWYMATYYGGGFKLNEGRQFFFLAEAYLNFGLLGIPLLAAAWGAMWGMLQRWMRDGGRSPSVVLIYALVVAFLFRCIAGDFATLVAGVTQQSLVAALVGLWLAGARWRRSGRQVASHDAVGSGK